MTYYDPKKLNPTDIKAVSRKLAAINVYQRGGSGPRRRSQTPPGAMVAFVGKVNLASMSGWAK